MNIEHLIIYYNINYIFSLNFKVLEFFFMELQRNNNIYRLNRDCTVSPFSSLVPIVFA